MKDAVGQIPDVAFVREQMARNIRERDLLRRLLKLAQRKADFAQLNDGSGHHDESEVQHD